METVEATDSRKRAVGAFTVALTAVWVLIAAYVLHASLPFNPIPALPFESHLDVAAYLPQGWAFFTKSPRTDRFTYFRPAGQRWTLASNGPQSRFRYLVGLMRSTRAESTELGVLTQSIPKAIWKDCKQDPAVCLASDQSAFHEVANPSAEPLVCGDVGFAVQPPVPWAWSKSRRPIHMPSKILKVRVQCSS